MIDRSDENDKNENQLASGCFGLIMINFAKTIDRIYINIYN